MDAPTIESTLARCESTLAGPGRVDLRALGFWKAVSSVKRRPELVDRFADRVGRVDREAFLRDAGPLVFPAALGVALLTIGTLVGIAIVLAAPAFRYAAGPSSPGAAPASPWMGILLIVATGALIGSTHGLAHFVVGSTVGIHFTHWYSRPPASPQPGFKTDYATYLRTPARSRAWMHASGAIVTKIVPFAVAALAGAEGAQAWTIAVLLALGVVQLVTDVTVSVRASDWKKFRREMRFA